MSNGTVKFDSYSHIEIDITQRMVEEQDRFVFEVISSWFEEKYQLKISKRILERALNCFKEEHLEEFASLMREMEEDAYDKCPICVNRNKNCQFGSLDCHFEEQITEDKNEA